MNDLIPPLHVQQEARGMLKLAQDLYRTGCGDLFEDYWYATSENWDVNIHDHYEDGKLRCCIYEVVGGEIDTKAWFEVKL